jgi:phytoene dehydrogenase-like protein
MAGQRVHEVAVIGAGIGGASFSYFLQNHFNKTGISARVTVFEQNMIVGGRLRELKGFGNTDVVELGGAAWTVGNRWMSQLAEEMHINHTVDTSSAIPPIQHTATRQPLNSKLGVWGEDGFFDLIAALESKDGLKSVAAAAVTEASFLENIGRNYQRQASSRGGTWRGE